MKAALVALAVVVLIVANEVFLTILLSLVFALGLDPLVGWFTGRGMGRGKAALLVFFLLFLAVFVIVVWAVTPIWNEIRGLVQDIPGYIDDLKDEPAFKQLADNTDAVDKAQERGRPMRPRRSRRRRPRCSGSPARWSDPCSAS